MVVLPPGRLEEAGAALEGVGRILGDAGITLGRFGRDVLRGEVEIFDYVGDNHVAGIPVLVHLVEFGAVEAVVEPRHSAVSL